jgi:hypothetical protein
LSFFPGASYSFSILTTEEPEFLINPATKSRPPQTPQFPENAGDVGKDPIAVFDGESVLISELRGAAIANSLKKLRIFTQCLGAGRVTKRARK